MFNRSKREQLKELRKYRKEIKNNYFDNDIGIEPNHAVAVDGVVYWCEPMSRLVIDDYDSGIGSIERSHRVTCGYTMITGYYSRNYDKTIISKLDFTFAAPQDVIKVNLDKNIREVKVNSTNLRYTQFQSNQAVKFDIVVDTDMIDTLIGLNSFIRANSDVIKSINLINSSKILDNTTDKILLKEKDKSR